MNRKSRAALLALALAATVPCAQASPKRLLASIDGSKHTIKGHLVKEVVEADDLMLKNKFAEAAERYHDALNHDPQNIQAHTGVGMALGKQFKLDAADDEFDKALALDPQNALAHAGKAMIDLDRLQSSSATVQKARDAILKDAEAQARAAVGIDSQSPEGHLYLGQVLKEQGRLDEASQELQTAVKADPDYSEAYAALGMLRLQQSSPVEASANFQKAIELSSGNSTAHYGLGKVMLQQGQVDQAIKEFNTALYQYPNSAPTRLALGEAYMQQGNTVAAVKEFQEAIHIKPENSDAYLHIAAIREGRGDYEQAIAELRSGLELMPDNSDLHLRVAENSLHLEKLDDAIKEYTQVLTAAPQSASAAKGLTRAFYLKSQKNAGGAFFASNDYGDAQQMIDKAVAMNPNDMELRLAQAKLRALSGEMVDLASLGQPKTDGERIAYAEALLAQNRFNEAHSQINQLIVSAPDAKQVLAIGDLSLMIKDLGDAENAYKKAATMPGGTQRAKRGLNQVLRAREAARQDATLADDLAKRNALASAIDRYRSSIATDPSAAGPRVGLARALEKFNPKSPQSLRQAVIEYQAYMALAPELPAKQVDKLNKHVSGLNQRATRLEQRLALQPKSIR